LAGRSIRLTRDQRSKIRDKEQINRLVILAGGWTRWSECEEILIGFKY